MELTSKQEAFALNLFSGKNQRDAYREAGYAVVKQAQGTIDANASRLANNVKVKARLAELQQAAEAATIATVVERKQILTEIARGKVSNLLNKEQRIEQGGNLDTASIQEIDTVDVKIGKGENASLATITKIKLHNPVSAIDLLNKMERIYEAEGSMTIDNRTLIINVISDKGKDLTQRLLNGERTE